MSSPEEQVRTVTVVVREEQHGLRLDKVVVEALGSIGRSRAKELFEQRAVRVDGHVAQKGRIAKRGETIEIKLGAPVDEAAVPTPDAVLDVRLERDDVVVVFKPAGQPTAPIRAGETGTLVNALVARYPEMAQIGHNSREPGIIHRLDTGTSGLLLAARTQAAFDELSQALSAGEIDKRYLLICSSEELADTGSIEFGLCPHPKDTRRVLACVHPRDVARYQPRPACTTYAVVERVGSLALVEAKAPKAARHQIRAHFAAIDHPLLGDSLYGGVDDTLKRQALHAHHLSWKGGETVPALSVDAALPEELRSALDSAR
jgi:23S rRNA pseudouridine1911/1915/1917 synthase